MFIEVHVSHHNLMDIVVREMPTTEQSWVDLLLALLLYYRESTEAYIDVRERLSIDILNIQSFSPRLVSKR
jgi:hypothetical protein